MSGQQHSQPTPLPLLSLNHTTSTTPSNLLLAPDGGVFDSELEHCWNNVKARLSAVLRDMQDHPLKTLPAEWVHIYTDVAKLYTENDAVRKRRMYVYVRQFIQELVKVQLHHLRPLGGTVLLSEYVRRWRATMTYVQFMKRVLHHLQRFWISENANTLKQDPIRPLDKLLMFYWREDLLGNLHSIVDICLALVDEDRRGIPIDYATVRGIVDNFVEIGAADLNFQDSERDPEDCHRSALRSAAQDLSALQLYIQVFEDRFLEQTRMYYKQEGALIAHTTDVSSFIKQVKALLDDEEKRARILLHQDSSPRVRQAVEEQLIGNHKEFLQQHANNMIESGSEEDLRLVYNLLDRIDGAMDPVRAFFVRFVRKEGNEEVAAHVERLKGNDEIRHNLVLVQLLIQLYLKHANMVKRCFDGANKIMLAIDDAFRGFVNRSLGAVSLPNLLAHYIDQLLRSNKPAGSLFLSSIDHHSMLDKQAGEQQQIRNEGRDCTTAKLIDSLDERRDRTNDPRARYINELVRILMYLDDKDMFFETHRRLFSKRLLSDHDEDMEALFISKLREQMGTTYTQRLSGMLQDIKISNTLREDFSAHLSQKNSHTGTNDTASQQAHNSAPHGLEIDFDAHVLNALHWPSVKVTDLVIPDVLQACQKTFSTFYMQNTETRKLTWVHSMSTVHVKVTSRRATYTLVVSTFQACTLMLFNEAEEIPLLDAAKKLNMSCEDLKKHIKPLLVAKKSKVLTLMQRRVTDASSSAAGHNKLTVDVDQNKQRQGSNCRKESLPDKIGQEETQSLRTCGSTAARKVIDSSGDEADNGSKQGLIESPLADCETCARSTDGELDIVENSEVPQGKDDLRKRGRVSNNNSQDTEVIPRKKLKLGSGAPEEGSDFVRQPSAVGGRSGDGGSEPDNDVLAENKRDAYDEILCINYDFNPKQHRIVVPSLMPRLASVEATVSRKNVVIDRNTQVDAALMRIMKLRKEVAYGDLCAEVIRKMSAMAFTPDVKLIKGRLDRLIDQDYIIRDEEDPRLYRYNA